MEKEMFVRKLLPAWALVVPFAAVYRRNGKENRQTHQHLHLLCSEDEPNYRHEILACKGRSPYKPKKPFPTDRPFPYEKPGRRRYFAQQMAVVFELSLTVVARVKIKLHGMTDHLVESGERRWFTASGLDDRWGFTINREESSSAYFELHDIYIDNSAAVWDVDSVEPAQNGAVHLNLSTPNGPVDRHRVRILYARLRSVDVDHSTNWQVIMASLKQGQMRLNLKGHPREWRITDTVTRETFLGYGGNIPFGYVPE